MSYAPPEFHLTRVLEDGSEEEPQVVSVAKMPWDTKMDRRGAMGTGIAISGLIAALKALSSETALALPSAQPGSTQAAAVSCTAPKDEPWADKGPIRQIAISPDSRLLASASAGMVKLWSLPGGSLVSSTAMADVQGLAIMQDGQVLVSSVEYPRSARFGTPGELKVRSLSDPGLLLWIRNDKRMKHAGPALISPDGSTVAVRTHDGIDLWSISNKKLFGKHNIRAERLQLAISPEGRFVGCMDAVGEHEKHTLTILDLSNAKQVVKFDKLQVSRDTGPGRSSSPWAISPDARFVTVAAQDNALEMWSVPSKKLLRTIEGERQGRVTALTISPDGRTLASGYSNGSVKLWSKDGELIATLSRERKTSVQILRFTPNGKLLIAVVEDQYGLRGNGHSIVLWDTDQASSRFCSPVYLFDPKATPSDVKAITYDVYDSVYGRTVTYTLPCGSPIPSGAVCTCNCVPGTYEIPREPVGGYSGGYTGGTTGTICQCNQICTCVPIPSSRRWKKNVQVLDRALDSVMQLRGVRFDWTPDAPHHPQRPSDIGLIAEEVAHIVPEIVSFDEQGSPRALDYARLTALLIEAMKTQQSEIQQLRAELQNLRGAK